VAIKGIFMTGYRLLARFFVAAWLGAVVLYGAPALNSPAIAQQPVPTQPPTAVPDSTQQPATSPAAPAPAVELPLPAKPAAAKSGKAEPSKAGEITEEEVRQKLVGKPLYLRGGYLDSYLIFNEHGALAGHSAQGSYTLNGIEITKVRLGKHKLELEGTRYGLHFLGALPNEDPTTAVDRVRITPNKKIVRITIDREVVVSARKAESPRRSLFKRREKQDEGDDYAAILAQGKPAAKPATTPATAPATATASTPDGMSDAGQAKAQIAAAPPAERPADPDSVTTTVSAAQAANVLREALDRVFAPGIDDRLKASMPPFWRLYYQAAAANTDYRPSDPAVLRQNAVDKKARLITTFEPESNEYAQAHAVAGMALYHTVIGADGKPAEIAVGRPIGFGLDENAVEAIRKATFEPAMKEGKPVPVLLDLVVQFRIYSKRTAARAEPSKPVDVTAEPSLPGPYSVQHP
jgi:hypothetical protein